MKITIESTTKIVTADGVKCRVWEGETERGVKVTCLVARVTPTEENADHAQFQADLREVRPPSPGVQLWPNDLIL